MYYEINRLGYYQIIDELNDSAYVILSDKKNSIYYNNGFYFYDIRLLLNPNIENGELYEVALWCEENCSEAWLVGTEISAFISEIDIMAFKLRWL